MTPLAELLARRIAIAGPITVAEYMADCLMHPDHGYYATRDPFGQTGDFTTAPEISQMFGEVIGLWLAQSWLEAGRPAPFTLAELGPGRGTLMADILRATQQVPGFHDAAQVHLVEASPYLRHVQSQTITAPLTHHDRADTLPEQPLFLIANEFFDALPIRQFIRQGAGWRERMVGLADGALAFGLSGPLTPPFLDHRADVPEGRMVEICPALPGVVETINARIAQHGGFAIIIDYGEWRSLGDTLQALRNHAPDPALAHPGMADLTAHVAFEDIARAAPDLQASGMTPQGVVLERLGITPRAQSLAKNFSGDALSQHIAAHRRLTHPAEMGNLFKVLGLHPKGALPSVVLDGPSL